MRTSSDFRRIAREALQNRWPAAVLAGIIAMVLGGIAYNGPEFNIRLNFSGAGPVLQVAGQTVWTSASGLPGWLRGIILYILLGGLIVGIARYIIGAVVGVGHARYHLALVDYRDQPVETLFRDFPHWANLAKARLLQDLRVLLGLLLLIVPGLMALYDYALTRYILAEDPTLDPREALRRSKDLMYGHRWRLFCLQMSFIGWAILSSLFTWNLGHFLLTPYAQTAYAAFYRELAGQ